MQTTSSFPCRGSIILISLDPTIGTEIKKTRACVVVSNDRANEFSPQLTVVPITLFLLFLMMELFFLKEKFGYLLSSSQSGYSCLRRCASFGRRA
jgi:hypothetical protein